MRRARAYAGHSTTGQPIATTSALRQQQLQGELWRSLEAGPATGWAVGARLAWRHDRRDLADAGPVPGYPERLTQAAAGVGLRWSGGDGLGAPLGHGPSAMDGPGATGAPAHPGQGLRFRLAAWAGAAPGGRLALRLPGADPLTLPLGGHRWAALEASVDGPLAWPTGGSAAEGGTSHHPGAGHWRWRLDLARTLAHWSAGDARAVQRQGVPVAAAWQPASREHRLVLRLGLTHPF